MIGLYSIYDSVVGEYGDPFYARNKGEAIRTFNGVMVRNPNVAKDCKLYQVGNFLNETGVLSGMENNQPEFICSYEVNE